IETYAELLVCGAHGRAWHRHEVAAKLVALARDATAADVVRTALDAPRACAAVDVEELTQLRAAARDKLAPSPR
nr:hypothetical protein [Deltaproteobacteria bacterium]